MSRAPYDLVRRMRPCRSICLSVFGPGHRTFGELVQERQWALQEIERLRLASRVAPQSDRPVAQSSSAPIATREPVAPVDLGALVVLRAKLCGLATAARVPNVYPDKAQV